MGIVQSKVHSGSASLAYERGSHEPGVYKLEFEDGLSVWITRIPLDEGRTQLAVFINTEDMDENGEDHDNGIPLMQVLLNDATLYDKEPT